MRRFVMFVKDLYAGSTLDSFRVSDEIRCFFEDIYSTFINAESSLETGFDDKLRRSVTDKLGTAGSDYRTKIYQGFTGIKGSVAKIDLDNFFAVTLRFIDQSIEVNKRQDNLYHAYNLVAFSDNVITIRQLYEMLEGQVAVLSSGKLSPDEAIDLLDALRNSSLYRPDQESYILYPNKKLPLFLDKNLIPKEDIDRIKLLKDLVTSGDTSIVTTDRKGCYHFNAGFNNAGFLTAALTRLKAESALNVTGNDQRAIEQLYERLFDHQSFTGRSGTFYKYEGLGCIYWHMVSKLLLSIGENIQQAAFHDAGSERVNRLLKHYNAVQKGIGAHKSPAVYGSFPFDPYSHTPMMGGVQQPGMTGQVKEDIISRFFELGMTVQGGQLIIQPVILKKDEFIKLSVSKQDQFPILSFTYCSIPFIYIIDGLDGIDIISRDGLTEHSVGYSLNPAQSEHVFKRDPAIQKIMVHFKSKDCFYA
jgi:hypothetical protein